MAPPIKLKPDESNSTPKEEEEEERGLTKDLKRHGQLAVAWDRHGSPVPPGGPTVGKPFSLHAVSRNIISANSLQ